MASLYRVPRFSKRRAFSRLYIGEMLLLLECWTASAGDIHALLVSLDGGLVMVTGTSGMPVTTPCISTGLPLAMAPDGAMFLHKPQNCTGQLARNMYDVLLALALNLYSWTKSKRILCIRLEAKVKRVSQK